MTARDDYDRALAGAREEVDGLSDSLRGELWRNRLELAREAARELVRYLDRMADAEDEMEDER